MRQYQSISLQKFRDNVLTLLRERERLIKNLLHLINVTVLDGFIASYLLKIVAPLACRPGRERLVFGVFVPGEGEDGGSAEGERTASSSFRVQLK